MIRNVSIVSLFSDFFVTLKSLQFYPVNSGEITLLNSLSHNANKNTTNEKTDKKKLRTKTNLYFIIVSTGNEQGLVGVKIHPTNGSVVFVESVDQRSHSVVPQLHHPGV